MKKLTPVDLEDKVRISRAIYVSLCALQNTGAKLNARQIARRIPISESKLSQMKRLSVLPPKYKHLVAESDMRRVLQWILKQYPFLEIFETETGHIQALVHGAPFIPFWENNFA